MIARKFFESGKSVYHRRNFRRALIRFHGNETREKPAFGFGLLNEHEAALFVHVLYGHFHLRPGKGLQHGLRGTPAPTLIRGVNQRSRLVYRVVNVEDDFIIFRRVFKRRVAEFHYVARPERYYVNSYNAAVLVVIAIHDNTRPVVTRPRSRYHRKQIRCGVYKQTISLGFRYALFEFCIIRNFRLNNLFERVIRAFRRQNLHIVVEILRICCGRQFVNKANDGRGEFFVRHRVTYRYRPVVDIIVRLVSLYRKFNRNADDVLFVFGTGVSVYIERNFRPFARF